MIHALVIKGYGINCENEMGEACRKAGATPSLVHMSDILRNDYSLASFKLLMLPGGFSFGDELGAGKAFANRLHYVSKFKEKLQQFVVDGGCILGVCNGFQLLVKLGLLPFGNEQTVTLAPNDSMKFENRWTHHSIAESRSVFTKGLQHLYLPVRHGEGKLIFKEAKFYNKLLENGQIVMRYANHEGIPTQNYPHNPNGSFDGIAGICDSTGRVLGMMAHPEAFTDIFQHPSWTKQKDQASRNAQPLDRKGDGLKLFQNAVNFIKGTTHEQHFPSYT